MLILRAGGIGVACLRCGDDNVEVTSRREFPLLTLLDVDVEDPVILLEPEVDVFWKRVSESMLRARDVNVSRLCLAIGDEVTFVVGLVFVDTGIDEELRLLLPWSESLRKLDTESGRLRLDDRSRFFIELPSFDLPYKLLVLLLKLLLDGGPDWLRWPVEPLRPVGGFGAKYVFVPGNGILLGFRRGVSGPPLDIKRALVSRSV